MSSFISFLLILGLLTLVVLFCFKIFLECQVLKMQLPKPKKRPIRKPKKVYYEDDLDD